jgi:hypothetical protein
MQQQINLFNTLPKVSKYYLSENLLLQILGSFLLILLMITFFQIIWLVKEKHDFSAAQKSFLTTQQELTRITGLTGQLDVVNVQKEIENKEKLLEMLQARKITTGKCSFLSSYFTALGEMTVPGLWFNQIGIDLNKDEVNLYGVTYAPTLMVQLVNNLNDTDCFADRQFGPMKIVSQESKEKNSLLKFVINSKNALTAGKSA